MKILTSNYEGIHSDKGIIPQCQFLNQSKPGRERFFCIGARELRLRGDILLVRTDSKSQDEPLK